MKAYELPVTVMPDGKLDIPATLLNMLPRGKVVRMIVLVNEPEDDQEEAAWSQWTAEQFLTGYDEADAIYHLLS